MARTRTAKAEMAVQHQPAMAATDGVFISHVQEDQELAQAFGELINDVTAGAVQTFSSSSRQVGEGIQYGEDWFRWICKSVDQAQHIVALLTPSSINRPWILFEAGLGKAKTDRSVFGVCIGIKREVAYTGPFGVLQNCGTDDTELIKLCKELVDGTAARPRDEMIARCVAEFKQKASKATAVIPVKKVDESSASDAVFKALEEMKSMLREHGRYLESDASPRSMRRMKGIEPILKVIGNMDPGLATEAQARMLASSGAQVGILWLQAFLDAFLHSDVKSPEELESLAMMFHHSRNEFRPDNRYEDEIMYRFSFVFDRMLKQRIDEASRRKRRSDTLKQTLENK